MEHCLGSALIGKHIEDRARETLQMAVIPPPFTTSLRRLPGPSVWEQEAAEGQAAFSPAHPDLEQDCPLLPLWRCCWDVQCCLENTYSACPQESFMFVSEKTQINTFPLIGGISGNKCSVMGKWIQLLNDNRDKMSFLKAVAHWSLAPPLNNYNSP